MKTVTITLITKPDCHLCDEARTAIATTRRQLLDSGFPTVLQELNMNENPALIAKYQEDIPVVLLDDRRHAFWRVNPERLITAVEKRARGGMMRFLDRK